MKKFLIIGLMCCLICPNVIAKCSHCGRNNCHHNTYHSSGSHDSSVHLVNTTQSQEQIKFQNCNDHYAITQIITNYYSDGTRRVYTNSNIYNSDGTLIAANCQSLHHIIFNDEHYFIIKRNKEYLIIDSSGTQTNKKHYTYMKEIAQNRILARKDKQYGIITLNEEIIVPIKYQKFKQAGDKIFITKLNGYYGIIDTDNNVLVENDCDSIKQLNDNLRLKKQHKYGLANADGKIILNIQYDKIKKLGEYIIFKKEHKYGVLNAEGSVIKETIYDDIKLERNKLKGLTSGKIWVELL